MEPNQPKFGWQQRASRQMEKKFVSDHLWPRFDNAQRALARATCFCRARSQLCRHPGPPGLTRSLSAASCAAGCTCPLSYLTAPVDVAAHSTSLTTIAQRACPEAGVLGMRGFPLECAAAQVCKEGGARVSTNVLVRDMDFTTLSTAAGWRWWRTGWLSGGELNSP